MAKEEKKAKKKVEAKKINDDKFIERKGYKLHFVNPHDEKEVNELVNTGRVIGQVMISNQTLGDGFDEAIIVVRN